MLVYVPPKHYTIILEIIISELPTPLPCQGGCGEGTDGAMIAREVGWVGGHGLSHEEE